MTNENSYISGCTRGLGLLGKGIVGNIEAIADRPSLKEIEKNTHKYSSHITESFIYMKYL